MRLLSLDDKAHQYTYIEGPLPLYIWAAMINSDLVCFTKTMYNGVDRWSYNGVAIIKSDLVCLTKTIGRTMG